MILRSIFYAFCFCLCLMSTGARASENLHLNQEQYIIIQKVVAGELNNSIHAEFWSYFSKSQISEARNSQEFFSSELPMLLSWQKAVWTSVRESFLASSVVKTDDYNRLKRELTSSKFKNSKEMMDAIKNAEMIVDLAAKRKNLQIANGILELNDKNAETVLVNLEAAFGRIEKLFDPDWRYEIDLASPETYASIIKKQKSWERRAAACHRFWHILAAQVDLAYRDAKKAGNNQKIEELGKSFLNIKWREVFIDKIVKQKQLEDLRDRAYALGAGVDLMDENTPQPIKKICGSEINNYLKLEPNISNQALSEAQQFIKNIR